MLVRIRERVLRWRMAQKKLARLVATDSARHALASIAAAADLGRGDAIAVQQYSLEAEIARGAALSHVLGAFGKKARRRASQIQSASALGLAVGIAGGLAPTRDERSSRSRLKVVVALLEGRLDDECTALLGLAGERKLPLVIVALRGAFSEAHCDDPSAYEFQRFPRIPVDRNDSMAMYRVAHEAIERARIGYGPTLVDCVEWPFAPPPDGLAILESALTGIAGEISARSDVERIIRSELTTETADAEVQLFAP